jgi:hypothetical protein
MKTQLFQSPFNILAQFSSTIIIHKDKLNVKKSESVYGIRANAASYNKSLTKIRMS